MSLVETDPYSEDPQPTGYTRIAEVEWRDESWQFDLTRVYRHDSGGIFYAEDTGCSCPIPFEGTTVDELKQITRMQDWYDHVTARIITKDPSDEYQYPEPTPTSSLDQAETARRVISEHLKASKES